VEHIASISRIRTLYISRCENLKSKIVFQVTSKKVRLYDFEKFHRPDERINIIAYATKLVGLYFNFRRSRKICLGINVTCISNYE
jgi:hypothetical protein